MLFHQSPQHRQTVNLRDPVELLCPDIYKVLQMNNTDTNTAEETSSTMFEVAQATV